MSNTAVKSRDLVTTRIASPSKYKVIFLNDDFTPVDFVIALLMSVFKHNENSATNITVQIHNEGAGVAGIYTFEIAEQKALDATLVARNNGHPLAIKVEEE
jgi:ATP-dependent Clp protease adaptor protein ClpS